MDARQCPHPTNGPWAYFAGRLATDLVEVIDLHQQPDAFDRGGWWAVVATYEGVITGYRFARVESQPLPVSRQPWQGPEITSWTSSLDQGEYLVGVQRIREYIAAGEVYQVNLCRTLSAPLAPPESDPFDEPAGLAQVLTAGNPAPYQGVLSTGDDWIVSASPELFLERKGSTVRSSPIKGTAPTAGQLRYKDYPENIMITDLVRNDLNRVCTPESLRVSRLLEVEHHPGLVHLVSTVTGTLKSTISWPQLFAATFPPGSVTGAPKIRASEVITELEAGPRGPYCGAFGYVDADHQVAQLAVGIRTFYTKTVLGSQRQLCFGSGAGITYLSEATDEWDETELKARRLIGLASTAASTPSAVSYELHIDR